MDAVYHKPSLQSFVMPLLEEQSRDCSFANDSELRDGKNSADCADAGSLPALNWRSLCNKDGQISQVSDAPSPNATSNMTAQKKAPARQTVPRRANTKKMSRPADSIPKRRASYGHAPQQLQQPQPSQSSQPSPQQQRPIHGRSGSYHSRTTYDPKEEAERVVITSEIALFMRRKMRYMDPNFKPIPPSPGGWEDVTPERVIGWEETTDRFSDFSPFLCVKRTDTSSWNSMAWTSDMDSTPTRTTTPNDVPTPDDKQPSSCADDKFSGHTSKIDTATPYHSRGTKSPPLQKLASKKPPPISTSIHCGDYGSARPDHMHHQRLLSDPMRYEIPVDDPRGARQDNLRLQLKSPMSARFAEPTTPRHLATPDALRLHFDGKPPNTETHRALFPQQHPPSVSQSLLKGLDSDAGLSAPTTPSSATPFASFSTWSSSGPTSPQDPWFRSRDRLASVDSAVHARSASLNYSQRRSSMWALDLPSPSNPWSPTGDDQSDTKNPRRTSSTSDVAWLQSPTANSSHGWSSSMDASSSDSGWSSIDDRFMSILKVVDEDHEADKSHLLQHSRSRGSSMVSDNGSSSNSSMVQPDGMSVLVANAQLLQNIVQTGRMGCRCCGAASHFVFRDCPFVLSKSPGDAWNGLMQAAQGYDVDAFMESLEMYSKSRPAETLQTIGHQLASIQSVIQLVAIEKRLSDTTLVMDLQGHPRRYVVSAMALGRGDDPLQAIRRLPGFPQSIEQNMIRLAESGFPRDLTEVAKCRVCKQAGHWVKDCTAYPEYQRRAGLSNSNGNTSSNSCSNSSSDLLFTDSASKKTMEGNEPYRLYYNMNDYVVVHRA